ncbi:MAG: IclR family transcriptional regulator [Chloroflexi bacterium]|nr:IclR family transcriptional regulator [Chloroflexota bacterium]
MRVKQAPPVEVVDRALRALEALGDEAGGLGVTGLGRRLGVDKSTAHRLLATMRARGFVRLNPHTQRYQLGLRLVGLGAVAAHGIDLTEIARPVIEALRDDTGEAASLAVLSGGEVLFLAKAVSSGALTVNHGVGTRLPAHCSALGKVLLAADKDPEQVDRVIAQRGLPSYTPRTITDPDDIWRHLTQVAARGWALDDEEYAVGLRCLAAPVRDASGDVVAAVGVSGPTARVALERVEAMAARVRQAGRDLSALLGYRMPGVRQEPAMGTTEQTERSRNQ